MQQDEKTSLIKRATCIFTSYREIGWEALKAYQDNKAEVFFDLLDIRESVFAEFRKLDKLLFVEYQVDIAQINQVSIIAKDLGQMNLDIHQAMEQIKNNLHLTMKKLDRGVSVINNYQTHSEKYQEKYKRII